MISEKRVYFLMVLASIFWSGAFITGKIAISQFTPFTLTFLRFLIALPFIFLILYKRQPEMIIPEKEQWKPLILLGVIGIFGYHALFFFCLKYTTAINSSLIGATNPMLTTLLAAAFFREKITPLRLLGILLSFFGVFLIITKGDFGAIFHLRFNSGDLIMLAAVCSMAIYTLLSRKFMDKYHIKPLTVTTYTFLVCTLVSIPFVISERPYSYLGRITAGGWLSVIYMAVFASVLGYLFQLVAIERIGAPKAAIFFNLVPVFTIFQSVFILGESFGLSKLLSASIIILGVYLTTRPEQSNLVKSNDFLKEVKIINK